MPEAPCRLLIDEPASGAWNMAVDEALLESAAESGRAILRLYRWSEPTLSLGYFQSYDDRGLHEASARLPVVRRSSGGGALVHHHEVTYSLALPASSPHTRDSVALTCLAHKTIIATIEELSGGPTSLTTCAQAISDISGSEPFLCFQRRAKGDLLCPTPSEIEGLPQTRDNMHKVCGSAQRKRRGAVLQHGGVLLQQSPAAPELPGLRDLGIGSISEADFTSSIQRNLLESLGLQSIDSCLTTAEVELAGSICKQKFDNPSWVERR